MKRGSISLQDAYPDLAAQWHPTRNGDLTPADVSRSSMRMVWWRCVRGHEWEATVNNRERGRGCPICGGKRVLAGFNDLATVEPEIAAQWHPTRNGDLTPHQVTTGSNTRVWWQCRVAPDHEWQVSISNRTAPSVRSGCPICAGRVVVASTSLASLYPLLAAQWHPTRNGSRTPQDVAPHVTTPVWWQCGRGHAWKVAVAARTRQGTGCPYCGGQRPIVGETDLATSHPLLAAQWHPTRNGDLTPRQVTAGSSKQVWWQCSHGHDWSTAPSNRTSQNSGCPYCGGQRPIVGETDLATSHPLLAAQWHPTRNGDLTPCDVMKGTTRKVWWQCARGHDWCASVDSRSRGIGCPICANKQVLAGFNDLATVNVDIAAQWHPTRNGALTPRQVTKASGRKVWWQCPLGHEWSSTVANRAVGQGCPTCAVTGFDPAADAWLYLLVHDQRNLHQLGITNHPQSRLARHRRNGWQVVDVRGPMPGDLAAALERAAIRSLSRRGACFGRRGDRDRFDGFTESWTTATITVGSLGDILSYVYADDDSFS